MKFNTLLRTSMLVSAAILLLSITLVAQINTTTCSSGAVRDPENGATVTSANVFDTGFGIVGSTTPLRQPFSSAGAYNFSTNVYSITILTAGLDLGVFEIVKGARAPIGGQVFQDTNGGGTNADAIFPLVQGTFNVGIAWTDIGSVNGAGTKGFIRFYGYKSSRRGLKLVEYKCLDVNIPPAGPAPCGFITGTNLNTGNSLNTFSLATAATTNLSFTAANATSFTLTNTSGNGSVFCANANCSQVQAYIPANGLTVSFTLTPQGCANPSSSTFALQRTTCSSPPCLIAYNDRTTAIAVGKTQSDGDLDIGNAKDGNVSLDKKKAIGKSVVFPNPTSGSVNVNTPSVDAYVQITNVLGQEVFKSTQLISNSQAQLDVSNLKGGLYLISIKDNTDRILHSEKLILRQ
jgi:hypothetical protein